MNGKHMKEYNNIKELEKDYPDLAIKVKEHFKDKPTWNNNEIILFPLIRHWIDHEIYNGYLSDIMKKLKTLYPEIYSSISYTWLTNEMLAVIDTNYYYFDEESEMIISILPN